MVNKNLKIFKVHFYSLFIVIFHSFFQYLTNFGLNYILIFVLKVIIFLTGIFLFFLNIRPFKRILLYYSYYLFSCIIVFLFWVFGGIFLAILSSMLLFPIFPKEIIYKNENLKIYSSFNGFFSPCCEYEVVESKLVFFEKHYGKIKIEDQIENDNCEIKISNNEIIYKHKVSKFKGENIIEIDTLEKIKIE